MIEVKNISIFRQKKQIVKEVSFQIRPGHISVMLGNNGAGKTTIFDALAGTDPPQVGQVIWDGQPLEQISLPEQATRRAVLSQGLDTPFALTVQDIVEMGTYGSQTPLPNSVIQALVDRALGQVELSSFRQRTFHTLSGGERKRALFAKCLVQLSLNQHAGHQQYLLLDEPTANLDVQQQFNLLALIRKAVQAMNLGVLAILHDINLAAQLADELLMLRQGELVAMGSPWKVLTPATLLNFMGIHAQIDTHPQLDCPHITYLNPVTIDKPISQSTSNPSK
ncbi:MAG: ATP-binding cassette domain-containing protein [Bacteroidota bacterium]